MRPNLTLAMRPLILAALCCAPVLAGGQSQPLSKSMAECGGLMLAASQMMQDPDRRDALARMAEGWAVAGAEQARDEGQFYPDFFVETAFRAAFDDWRGRGRLVALTEEFEDWTAYCRSLAEARGLDLYHG